MAVSVIVRPQRGRDNPYSSSKRTDSEENAACWAAFSSE